MTRVKCGELLVAQELHQFVEQFVLPEIDLNSEVFWSDFSNLVRDLTPKNKQLLAIREELQTKIDCWHITHEGNTNLIEYKKFLQQIGYIKPSPEAFSITTKNVDSEVATLAGPQLVVPINNARYALNAANARWGSLYDALYGTDVISEESGAEKSDGYNPARGAKVVAFAKAFLNQALPLNEGSHLDATVYQIKDGALSVTLDNGIITSLVNPAQLIGFTGEITQLDSLILKHNGLHIEICFDSKSIVAQGDKANISDIQVESALTTIMDCEDSVAAVDAEDKVQVYKNWLGLIKGDLTESVTKGGKEIIRQLSADKSFTCPDGSIGHIKGRCLMFIRNVGHLMTNNAILTADGEEVYEGILDAVITSAISKIDILSKGKYKNSEKSSIYIVKPKMHGPDEVAYASELFARTETMLGLPNNTLKMGIMDEERRTSVNLAACIHAAKERVVFINTGFLDRTGDEIHTSMQAGPMVQKAAMKSTEWISAYENSNVDIGLACGLSGKAQIGKGMWAMPDLMAQMIEEKAAHPKSGANTAWVPSPTAATLHALHYHQIDVFKHQESIARRQAAAIDDLIKIPVDTRLNLTAIEVERELDNNAQGILGYVVRWVEQGVGCSKVPDINNIGLMEDRATLRISSQHMTNWLLHGICSEAQVLASLKRMAKVVDEQNADDPLYSAMADNFDQSVAFQAALELVLKGKEQPSGYTEPILHKKRLAFKRMQNTK